MDTLLKFKKPLLISGFILIVVAVGSLLYLLFFKPAQAPEIAELTPARPGTAGFPVAPSGPGQVVTPATPGGLPAEATTGQETAAVANGGLTQTSPLNQSISLGATLAGNGLDLQYYDTVNGLFYRLTSDGQISPLTDRVFHQVESIVWSPDKDRAILEFPDGANIIYNFTTKQQITLPSHWQEFAFSPDGKQIVMKSLGLDQSNRWLAIVSSDGQTARGIEPLGDKEETVYPAWSNNNQVIAMYTEGIGLDRQQVYFVGLNQENFKSTIIEGRGFEPIWSPRGDRLLYSVYSNETNLNPHLWIVSAQGEAIGSNRINLNLATWAHKCVFANDTDIYCGVPEKLPEGSGLLPELANDSRDLLYKIDSRSGLKQLVAIPAGNYHITNPIISDNGYYVYFTDQLSGRLFKIKLK